MAHCWVIVCAFFFLLHGVELIVLTMSGAEVLTYDLSKEKVSKEKLQISLNFKTISPSGLLLFSENTYAGDYVSLELVDGKLRYKARLGYEETPDREQEILAGFGLNDYKWHSVCITMERQNVTMEIDNEKISKFFTGEFIRIDLDEFAYFGGVSKEVDTATYSITHRKYAGCLDKLFFNDVDILFKSKFRKQYFSSSGDILWNECEQLDYQPIMMKNPQDYALLPTYLKNRLNVVFKFRTHVGEGLLFAKLSQKVTIHVTLRKGILLFSVHVPGVGPVVMRQGNNLDDGFWHRVEFLVSKDVYKLRVDRHQEITHSSPWSHSIEFQRGNATIGGGEEQIMEGFSGCMYDIWVDNTPIDYNELAQSFLIGTTKGCALNDRCLFSPCKNNGTCSQDYKSYSCHCSHTMYSGEHCEQSIYQPSCQEYQSIGLKEDSYCFIDPDGAKGRIKPFKVFCNVTADKNNAVTVFQHNLNKNDVYVSSGIVKGNEYHHSLKYGISMEAFDSALQSATHCRQYIDFKCKKSFLFRSPRGPADTAWIGRNGNYETYWGGAAPDSGTCACRKNNSCAHPYRYCNCDIGDDVWREDKGYFTEIDRLPVFSLIFKTSANQSLFTVGNLECQFNSTIALNTLSRERVLKACTSISTKYTTKPLSTKSTLNQKEEFINWSLDNRIYPDFTRTTEKTSHLRPILPNVNVNVTVELPSISNNQNSKKEEGLKFTLSVYAVIVIAVATVIVVVIIAIVVVAKRYQERQHRNSRPNEYDSDEEYAPETERTEMCTFFGTMSRSERDRPIIEVHRHSIHCETLEDLPPAYREFTDYAQPITTHIDLSYKPRKKNFGIFC